MTRKVHARRSSLGVTFPAPTSRYRKQDRYRRHGSADIRIPDQTFTPKQHDLGQDCIQANQGRRKSEYLQALLVRELRSRFGNALDLPDPFPRSCKNSPVRG